MTNGNRATYNSMTIMQLGVPGVNVRTLPKSKGEMTRSLLYFGVQTWSNSPYMTHFEG